VAYSSAVVLQIYSDEPYYARHGARATRVERFLCSKRFMVICAITGFILGAVGGYFLFRDEKLWLQIPMVPFVGGIGVFIAGLMYLQLGKLITKRVCGVSDTRTLT